MVAVAAILLAAGSARAADQATAAAATPAPDTAAEPSAAAPPPSNSAATSAPGSSAPGTTQGGYTVRVRLHDLERRVNELKEQIFRSKGALNLLKETVLPRRHRRRPRRHHPSQREGGIYMPVRYVYALDGQEIYSKSDDTGKLGDQKEIEVFNGSITPGNHTLSVQMIYQGNGYGVFSYLKGYSHGQVEPSLHGARGQAAARQGGRLREGQPRDDRSQGSPGGRLP